MVTLAVAAGATERIRLGTAILCAPFRHPTIIAKEVASLDSLSGGGRVILGIGTGHDDMEFASVGVPRRERGRRTDEALELIGLLLGTDEVSYRGDYYSVADGTTLYPRPAAPIPIWIGGGSQVHVVDNVDTPNMAPAVLARIGRHDGWICRSSGTSPEIVADDIASVRGYLWRQARHEHLHHVARPVAAHRRLGRPPQGDRRAARRLPHGDGRQALRRRPGRTPTCSAPSTSWPHASGSWPRPASTT